MKRFTVVEANSRLPEVKELLGRIRKSVQAFEQYRKIMEIGEGDQSPSSDTPVIPAYFRLVTVFHGCMTRIREIGCEIKDVGRGLVDFPAIVEGQEAYLCWQEGEDRVRYWHGVGDGFAGRRLIED